MKRILFLILLVSSLVFGSWQYNPFTGTMSPITSATGTTTATTVNTLYLDTTSGNSAINVESNLDATGYTVTASSFVGDTITVTTANITNLGLDIVMGAYDISSVTDINASGTVTASAFIGDGSGLTGISSWSAPNNIVYVDSGIATDIAGKVYSTWASADAYVQTQSPTSINTWAIIISGTNNEDIVIRDQVAILGNGNTRLTGGITSAVAYAGAGENSLIKDCIVTNYANTNASNFCSFDGCQITGTKAGVTVNDLVIVFKNSYVSGGTWTSAGTAVFLFYGGYCQGGSYPNTLSTQGASFLGGATLSGGNLRSTYFAGTNTYVTGNYNIENCTFANNGNALAIGNGNNIYIENSHIGASTTIRIDAGGNLYTGGLTGSGVLTISNNGGTWTNEGVMYDNTTSGLAAVDVQAALDEIMGGDALALATTGNSTITTGNTNISVVIGGTTYYIKAHTSQ